MTPFWHPLSNLLLDDPPTLTSPRLLRLLLRAGRPLLLRYAGDRMWPAVRHGATVEVAAADGVAPAAGQAVVVCAEGVPDLLRVEEVDEARGRVVLTADGDPGPRREVAAGDVLAVAPGLERRASGALRRSARRLALDLGEAWSGRPDEASDAVASIRAKYEAQAPFYAAGSDDGVDAALVRRLRARLGAGRRRLIVLGSGAGRECFGLARDGWEVTGVDFATEMVRRARAKAESLGLAVRFERADFRDLDREPGSLDGVLFTYDVYSLLPIRADRVALLAQMRPWLAANGAVLVSARRIRSVYQRAVLTCQWLRRRGAGRHEWGATHTRWIATDGSLRRSFLRVFSERELRSEFAEAGYRCGAWARGHVVLEPVPEAATGTMP